MSVSEVTSRGTVTRDLTGVRKDRSIEAPKPSRLRTTALIEIIIAFSLALTFHPQPRRDNGSMDFERSDYFCFELGLNNWRTERFRCEVALNFVFEPARHFVVLAGHHLL